jgi:hypothetical protein
MMLIMVMRSKFFIATTFICLLSIETEGTPLPITVLSVASSPISLLVTKTSNLLFKIS